MKTLIKEELALIERKHQVKILFACESGSRAWGFPSVDRNYDVRFFYTHPIEKYFAIDAPDQHIEDVGSVLDFSGWELSKMLKLLRSSNSSIFEKLQSGIIYKEIEGFKDELWDLGSLFYNPISGGYHYLSLTKKIFQNELGKENVSLKKYFYALRSVLCAKWIRLKNEIPPLEFYKLKTLEKDSKWNEEVKFFLQVKIEVDESYKVEKSDLLNLYIQKELEVGMEYFKSLKPKEKISSEMLNEMFRRWIN